MLLMNPKEDIKRRAQKRYTVIKRHSKPEPSGSVPTGAPSRRDFISYTNGIARYAGKT